LLWMAVVTMPLLVAVQSMAAPPAPPPCLASGLMGNP
jgi:hypothetical protein